MTTFTFALVFIVALFVLAFCAGIAFSTIGKAIFRLDAQNMFVRMVGVIKRNAGYLASFGVGVIVMAALSFVGQPYLVAQWAGMYENAMLGSLIISDETILQTGQIPQDMIDWYASRQ